MIAPKLKPGDELSIVAPSKSLSILSNELVTLAADKLIELGFKVTYGRNARTIDNFLSSPVKARVEDLHEAFLDSHVKGILTVVGGFNTNQMLGYIDYNIVRQNPKVVCGYSDITALTNAIYAQTGLVTYSGPYFSTFSMKKGLDYVVEYFRKCLMSEEPFEVLPSPAWSDDSWYKDQENREFIPNDGYVVINEGEAEGIIIGGNLSTFSLLQGTRYMPKPNSAVLFLEDDSFAGGRFDKVFDRYLQPIIQQSRFENVKGIVLGRWQKGCDMNIDKLRKIISTKGELKNIPVIYGVDFGHTTPLITFPIGGTVSIAAKGGKAEIKIEEH